MKIARNSTISGAIAYAANVATGAVLGAVLDLVNAGSCMLVFTTPSYTTQEITIEHSDAAGSGFTTVPVADLIGISANPIVSPSKTLPTAASYVGGKRYLRVNRSVGTGVGADVPACACIAIQADLAHGA